MVDDIFDTSRPRGRVEIRSGVGRRCRWTEEEKGRIVRSLMDREQLFPRWRGGTRSVPRNYNNTQ
jgi:hypothetical protein